MAATRSSSSSRRSRTASRKREKAASRKSFSGCVWVDEAAREVIRVDATAVDTISFGFGLIARLNEGTTVTLHREPIDGGDLAADVDSLRRRGPRPAAAQAECRSADRMV